MKIWKLFTVVIALGLSANVSAELISTDWRANNDGLITLDTRTGLEWLDLTETQDESFDYVSSQLGIGGAYEGWQYASELQLTSLFDSAGGSGPYAGLNNNGIVQPLINLWGETFNNTKLSYSSFLTSNPYENGNVWYGYIFDSVVPDITYDTADYMILYAGATPTSRESPRIGSSLVRVSSVPVPAAVWLFGSGLITLVGFARRKKA